MVDLLCSHSSATIYEDTSGVPDNKPVLYRAHCLSCRYAGSWCFTVETARLDLKQNPRGPYDGVPP